MRTVVEFAVEREHIRIRKEVEGLPAPWTDDPILQKYRFTNIRRRDDRVSRWIIENVLNHYGDFDNKFVFLQWLALCRWVNWPPTLEHLILEANLVLDDSIDLPAIGREIEELRRSGAKAWTGAYMVRAPKKELNMTKGAFIAEHVVGGMASVKDELLQGLNNNSVEGLWRTFRKVPTFGPFMAGQVVADLTYTEILENAPDLKLWAPQGPGSIRGLNRILERPLKARFKEEEWCVALMYSREKIIEALGKEYEDLTLHDIQNVLCEYDKYVRTFKGEGKPRSKYKPETAF